MEQEATYVGIDVAKSRVDVPTRPGGDVWRVDYDESGIASLIAQLQTLNSAAVLLEATGGIEVPLVSALAASLPVVVVNPRQVQGLCEGYWQVGQDGRFGCPRPGPVC